MLLYTQKQLLMLSIATIILSIGWPMEYCLCIQQHQAIPPEKLWHRATFPPSHQALPSKPLFRTPTPTRPPIPKKPSRHPLIQPNDPPKATTLPLSPQTLTSIPSSSDTRTATMTTLSPPRNATTLPHITPTVPPKSKTSYLSLTSWMVPIYRHKATTPSRHFIIPQTDPLKATAPNHYFITL